MFNPLYLDLMSLPKMTDTRLKNLLQKFKSPEMIFEASLKDLVTIEGMSEDLALAIKNYQRPEAIKKRIAVSMRLNIKTISFLDEDYPKNLRTINDFPPVLFVRGEIKNEDTKALAIIGTRSATDYGKQIAFKFAFELASYGITIVSGLARGIDTKAHEGAIKAKGRTVGVLGCGIDIYYPPENRNLYAQIAQSGAVITEFNFGTPPWAYNFPKRNRLISGLALGVLAIEARCSSGVLNTVQWAANQGRDVYVVPGDIRAKTSEGTNQLIKEGAKPVTSVKDILTDLGIAEKRQEKLAQEISETEKQLLEIIATEPLHIDKIAELTNIEITSLLALLLELEIKGLVKQLPGKRFLKNF
uniref:DNA-protecting protein DprA n=1 Tax=candidate division WOR-3 bacterium TaxID=2052148 RepID=A0A7C6E9Y1_UNCW3